MYVGLVFFFNIDISLLCFDIFYDVNVLGLIVNLFYIYN